MTEDMIDLARRAVACKAWRWVPGMRWWTDDDRGRLDDFQPEYMGRPTNALPDLTDAATLGALFALVTEAYYDPKRLWDGYVEVHRDQHSVFYLEQAVHDEDGYLVWNCVCSGETKAEVLVRALEIAASPETT